MWRLFVGLLLLIPPAIVEAAPKTAAGRNDPCAPIGRTADGKLVYSMTCENLPAPPAPAADVKEAPPPPPEAEVQRSGIFGWSYDRR